MDSMKHYSTYQSQFIEMFGTLDNPKGEIESLGSVCIIQRGGSPRPISEYITNQSDGLNWIKIGDTDDSMYITKTEEKIKPSGLRKTREVYAGDLLLSNSMSFGRPYILKIDGCIHDGWLVLHINDAKKLSPVYLCSYLSQQGTYAEMAKLAAGGVVQNLNSNIVKQLDVIVPDMKEQMKYIQILEQADKSKFTRLKSQFIEIFEGDKYPRLSLDAISEEWSKGQGFKKDDICEDGETQCIHYGELFTKYGPVINEVVSRTSVEKKKTSKKGDILFPASDVTPNGLARCSMLPFDNVILGGDIIILRPKENYNAAYLSYAINQQTSQLLTRVNGGVVKHMSAKGLKTVEIPIPPIDKQEEYIKIAEQADKSKYIN